MNDFLLYFLFLPHYFTMESTTQTRTTTPKREKSPQQLLHKSPICLSKTIEDWLKNLSLKKSEQLKKKRQAPIGQAGKIQTNTKVNNEILGNAFKLSPVKFDTVPFTSRIKSRIRMNKQDNTQGSKKSRHRSNCTESMNSDTDCIVANLNLEDIIK